MSKVAGYVVINKLKSIVLMIQYTIIFYFQRFYLFVHERQRHRQREKQAPFREPDVGLDPGTPGLRPGLKTGAKPLNHPGVPSLY